MDVLRVILDGHPATDKLNGDFRVRTLSEGLNSSNLEAFSGIQKKGMLDTAPVVLISSLNDIQIGPRNGYYCHLTNSKKMKIEQIMEYTKEVFLLTPENAIYTVSAIYPVTDDDLNMRGYYYRLYVIPFKESLDSFFYRVKTQPVKTLHLLNEAELFNDKSTTKEVVEESFNTIVVQHKSMAMLYAARLLQLI